MPIETFRSKVDWWLAMAIAVSIGAGTYGAFVTATAGPAMLPFTAMFLVGGIVLPAWIVARTEYTLSDRELLVRSGPFRWHVPIGSISRIHNTRNPLSSPALSLDRIHIEYSRGKDIMISPQKKEQFLFALETRRKAVA